MTTTSTGTFVIHAIPSDELEAVRCSGVDVSGHPIEAAVATGGEPLRCCLRDARDGERIILFGYEPVIPASPYREIGAIFAHADACPGPVSPDDYPADWRGRRQVLRAYDRRGWIHPSTCEHDGSEPEAVLSKLLADPEVERIHSRNVLYGCYMFTVTRA